jgi:hypothetical protein
MHQSKDSICLSLVNLAMFAAAVKMMQVHRTLVAKNYSRRFVVANKRSHTVYLPPNPYRGSLLHEDYQINPPFLAYILCLAPATMRDTYAGTLLTGT